jgi:hypothetical protein
MTLEAALVVVGAIATVIAVAALAARLPARRPPPDAPPSAMLASRPTQLVRIERIVERAGASDALLRPLLAEIAEARLGRRGLSLDDAAAPALLGPELWELVQPAPAQPRGVTPGELGRVIDRLEAL